MKIPSNKQLIIFPVAVTVLLLGILVFLFINGQPKTVATYEQVWQAAEDRGFYPIDSTEAFKESWGDSGDSLKQSLSFELGSTKFNFFVLDSEKSAQSIRTAYWRHLRYESGRYGTAGSNIEYESGGANFLVYSCKTDEYYTVCTRVGNTVIYAETDADANKSVCEIIEKIGYN